MAGVWKPLYNPKVDKTCCCNHVVVLSKYALDMKIAQMQFFRQV